MNVATHLRNYAYSQFGIFEGFYHITKEKDMRQRTDIETEAMLQAVKPQKDKEPLYKCCVCQTVWPLSKTHSHPNPRYSKTRTCGDVLCGASCRKI